ncbi:MAG: hypothetical protein ACOY0T_34980 [Myxococcota bacterium]
MLHTPKEGELSGRAYHPNGWRERVGLFGGFLLAPVTFAISRLRAARMFHPDGTLYEARLEPWAKAPDLHALAERLAGGALVRLSSAWWRGKDWPDVLGMAVRFCESSPERIQSAAGDQDLLLATIRFPWTTPFAPLTTRFTSFLWNHYHAVSPFQVDGVGRVKLRLRSPRLSNSSGSSRSEHLQAAVAAGRARFVLEARRMDRSPLSRSWEPVAELTLKRPIELDQASLRFSAFRQGRGVRPIGFVHALRVAAYAASQRARSRSTQPTLNDRCLPNQSRARQNA